MKIKIYRTRKRVPVSVNILNLSQEAERWVQLEKKLLKRFT